MNPQQARSVRSRQRLLDAARKGIEEVGIDGLTLNEVARTAGVAVGTVYNRFRDRRHLIEEVVSEWTSEVTAAFEAQRSSTEAHTAQDLLKALIRLFADNRVFIRQIIIHAPLDPSLAAGVDPWLAGEHGHLTAGLAQLSGASLRDASLVSTMVLATVERACVKGVSDEEWDHLEHDLPELAARLLL